MRSKATGTLPSLVRASVFISLALILLAPAACSTDHTESASLATNELIETLRRERIEQLYYENYPPNVKELMVRNDIVLDLISAYDRGGDDLYRFSLIVILNHRSGISNLERTAIIQCLERSVKDSSSWVRTEAVYGLGILGTFESIPSIISLLDDPDAKVINETILTLAKLSRMTDLPISNENMSNEARRGAVKFWKDCWSQENCEESQLKFSQRNTPDMEGNFLLNVAPYIILGIVLLATAVKRTQDTERLFVFRLGRPYRLAGPGIIWLIPSIDKGIRVDLKLAAPNWRILSEYKVFDLVLEYLSNEKQPLMATQDLALQSDLLKRARAQGLAIRIYHRHVGVRWVGLLFLLLGVIALLFFGAIWIQDGLPPDLVIVVMVLGMTIPGLYASLRKEVITIDPRHSRITSDKRLLWYNRKSTWDIDTFSVIKLTTTISDGSTSYDVTLFGPESAAVSLMKQDIFAKDILTVLLTSNEAQATGCAIDLSRFLNLPVERYKSVWSSTL